MHARVREWEECVVVYVLLYFMTSYVFLAYLIQSGSYPPYSTQSDSTGTIAFVYRYQMLSESKEKSRCVVCRYRQYRIQSRVHYPPTGAKGATLSHFVVDLAVCSLQVFRCKIRRMLCYDVLREEMQGSSER
jgi:hypothetical protein